MSLVRETSFTDCIEIICILYQANKQVTFNMILIPYLGNFIFIRESLNRSHLYDSNLGRNLPIQTLL